jgi:hypothetical protein
MGDLVKCIILQFLVVEERKGCQKQIDEVNKIQIKALDMHSLTSSAGVASKYIRNFENI